MLSTLIGIIIGARTAGLPSWGSLVPAYFLFMLLIFPLINYFSGSYEYYIVVPSEEDIIRLYLLCTLGIVMFVSAYVLAELGVCFVIIRSVIDRFSRSVTLAFSHKLNVIFLILLTLVATLWSMRYGYFGLSNRDSAEVGNVAGVIGIVSSLLSYVNIILWATYWQCGKAERSLALPGLTLFLLLFFALFANSKGALIFPLLHVLLAYYFSRNRLPLTAIVVIAVFFFLFAYPVVQGFRYAVYFDLADKTPFSIFPALISYFFSFSWLDAGTTPEGEEALSLGRGLFSYLTYIFKVAGDTVPYLNGSTYFEGLEIFVPRIILPDKVDMSIGHWTGQLFGHVALNDPITNVSPTYMGEFYMNNGVLGLVVGMLLLGVFARLVDECIFKASGSWLKIVFVLNILWLEAFVGTTLLPFLKLFLMFVLCVYTMSIFAKRTSWA